MPLVNASRVWGEGLKPRFLKPRVHAIYSGCSREASKLCLFASYDANSRVAPVVLHYLQELRTCGFDIVFCTTSQKLAVEDLHQLKALCCAVVHRENKGHDFYSWKVSFELLADIERYQGLLLTNDSIVGPLRSLAGEFEQIDRSGAQCLALNDSYERGYHLQSFFLYFKSAVFTSPGFRRFWHRVQVLKSKTRLVKEYEVGLSQWLQARGVVLEALYPIDVLTRRCIDLGDAFQYREHLGSAKMNPTLMCWHELIEHFRYPFVKADVVRKNRYFSESYGKLGQLFSDCLPPAVAEDLRAELTVT